VLGNREQQPKEEQNNVELIDRTFMVFEENNLGFLVSFLTLIIKFPTINYA
jgi:hypothetical protein